MTSFSDSFRRNVTIPAALSAMLYSEEFQGSEELARKTQIAIENVHSDLQMLAAVDRSFDPKVTEKDALYKLIEMAQKDMRADHNLLADEAILAQIEEHQLRKFLTVEDARNRVDMVSRAFSMAPQILQGMAAA